jgi:hypothetical protein
MHAGFNLAFVQSDGIIACMLTKPNEHRTEQPVGSGKYWQPFQRISTNTIREQIPSVHSAV